MTLFSGHTVQQFHLEFSHISQTQPRTSGTHAIIDNAAIIIMIPRA
jgi:hypothetical protein